MEHGADFVNIKRNFSDRMRELQAKLGITQKKFAERINVHHKSVNNHMTGKTTPDSTALANIAANFGVSPSWLLLGEGPMFASEIGSGGLDKKLQAFRPKRRLLANDFIDLLDKLESIDRFDEWLKQAGGDPAFAETLTDSASRIEEEEWRCLAAFIPMMKRVVRLQPRHLHRRRGAKPSAKLKSAMDRADAEMARIKSEFYARVDSIGRKWKGEWEEE